MLAQRARERGQSLQAFLLALVEAEARRSRNVELMGELRRRGGGSHVTPEETATELEQIRAARDTEIGT